MIGAGAMDMEIRISPGLHSDQNTSLGGVKMQYNFDQLIHRTNTASEKWDQAEKLFGEPEILPMWVADMDFVSPQPVIDAILKRAEHGVFGYAFAPDSYYEAVMGWMDRRHKWPIQKDWICYSPGVVTALSLIVMSFTQPGDKVVIQPPVYPPFASTVKRHGRELVYNPLKYDNRRYFMDLEDLKSKLDARVKLLILCSPHNPVGRVWTKEELKELGEICLANNVLIISDEIHCDLVYSGSTHTPFASMGEGFAMNTITCMAPSKTFNLAGLQTSAIIIPNPALRKRFKFSLQTLSLGLPNIFGMVAAEAAYRYGDEWLDQCLNYIKQNLTTALNYFRSEIPNVNVIEPQGTYLVWLDFRELEMKGKELEQFLSRKAKVGLSQGYMFGPGGEGFARMNIACPRSVLMEGLERIKNAVKE